MSQDSDTKYPHRKPFVRFVIAQTRRQLCGQLTNELCVSRVSNGPMNRTVRGYNGSDNSKLRKGVYSSSRSSRERRQIPQDRDSAFKGNICVQLILPVSHTL